MLSVTFCYCYADVVIQNVFMVSVMAPYLAAQLFAPFPFHFILKINVAHLFKVKTENNQILGFEQLQGMHYKIPFIWNRSKLECLSVSFTSNICQEGWSVTLESSITLPEASLMIFMVQASLMIVS
jgi:hypothetical protein